MTATVTLPRERLIDLFTLRIRRGIYNIKYAPNDASAFKAYFDATNISTIAENIVDMSDDATFKAAMTDAMIDVTMKLELAFQDHLHWESRTSSAEHWIRRK